MKLHRLRHRLAASHLSMTTDSCRSRMEAGTQAAKAIHIIPYLL